MMIASLFVYATSVFGCALTAAGVKAGQLAVFGVALAVGRSTAFAFSASYDISGPVASSGCSWALGDGCGFVGSAVAEGRRRFHSRAGRGPQHDPQSCGITAG